MSLFSKKTKQKLNQLDLSKMTTNAIQQEYQQLCAQIGQTIIHIEGLQTNVRALAEQIDAKKKRIAQLAEEMPKAQAREPKAEVADAR